MGREPERITELEQLKAFTHPLRIELYRLLTAARTATASHLAEQADEAVSLVSYHLRKLAEHGFIEEAAEQGRDGRERWWRVSAQRSFSFRSADFDDTPEGTAALTGVTRELLATRTRTYLNYLDQQAGWGREWTRAAFTSEYTLRLTAGELQELAEEMGAFVRRWRERAEAAAEAGADDAGAEGAEGSAGRETVALHLYGFPFRP
ncbi:ArsR/SmtB family transcription factor [Streptomyces phytophilus]|uniref:ArsR/SmtB family transcription factor n=1 Tax=Streptomyces phytophilus TaxID=722715 RepID=UPI0015F013A9|nr:helix-turn-helix domain-containing protein [Streptomyces phytophilus]